MGTTLTAWLTRHATDLMRPIVEQFTDEILDHLDIEITVRLRRRKR